MTVNVAVVTSEAIVFGCDSISTGRRQMLDPAKVQVSNDERGRLIAPFSPSDLETIVVSSKSGVKKLFAIGTERVPVVAVTTGLAQLRGRTIWSLALEFRRSVAPGESLEAIVGNFAAFMRAYYDQHGARGTLNFLVGGFGKDAKYPALYRIRTAASAADRVERILEKGRTGMSWDGRSDAIERVVLGFDTDLRREITKLNQAFPFTDHRAGFDYDLPLQEAINMVSYLVLVQAAKERFAPGIPAVGGRTHIAAVTRDMGVQLVNEPDLMHTHIGFFDDH